MGELTRPAGYVLVLSRVLYSGIAAVAVTYLVGVYALGLSPSLPLTLAWGVLFIVTSLVVIITGFKVWVFLSWTTAWVIFPSVRRLFDEYEPDQKN